MPSILPPLAALAPGVSAAGKLDRDDIEALADSGVRTIVNNRPDGEDPGQLPADEARLLAESRGIAYHHIPVTAASLTRGDVDAMVAVLAKAERPDCAALPQRDSFDAALGARPPARRRRTFEPCRRGGASRHRHCRPAGNRGTPLTAARNASGRPSENSGRLGALAHPDLCLAPRIRRIAGGIECVEQCLFLVEIRTVFGAAKPHDPARFAILSADLKFQGSHSRPPGPADAQAVFDDSVRQCASVAAPYYPAS